MLCGLLCGGADSVESLWLAELLPEGASGDLLDRECRAALVRLAERTRAELEGPGLGFHPLLPAEDASLGSRVSALGEWCDGFLYGLGIAGCDLGRLSDGAREALQDLTAMTRVDFGEELSNESDEEDFAEVSEFTWVAAMLVYHDLVPDRRDGS